MTYYKALAAFQRRYYAKLLKRARGNVTVVARLAGMDRCNLYRALARLGLDPDSFRCEAAADNT